MQLFELMIDDAASRAEQKDDDDPTRRWCDDCALIISNELIDEAVADVEGDSQRAAENLL